jgi:signal peptidase I
MSLKKKSVLRDWVESIIIAFLLAMVIRAFVVQLSRSPRFDAHDAD